MRSTAKCRRPRRVAALPFALVLGAVCLAGCGDDEEPAPEASVHVEETRAGGEDYDFVYGDLAEGEFWNDVDTWVGKRITLRADVGEVVDEHAFTVADAGEDDGDNLGDRRNLLVVSADPHQAREGSTVRVTGTVREGFAAREVADDLGVEWEADLLADWEEELYLVATAVDTSVGRR
ncbi:hypothetical protein F0L17_12365 [Streptomyces sp. TRM43335]|uniref:Lipoprotein n=1 Tax=Streptomyces taklimakanensis TaxID=2569853 RepID=A0A6G2BC92_9ACTN|nr:hypothetical protein [Streptomyces taklimakanensis]MTE19895.1 hypothetical protein [Streptomyces taklimakanensis]